MPPDGMHPVLSVPTVISQELRARPSQDLPLWMGDRLGRSGGADCTAGERIGSGVSLMGFES